MTMILFMCGKNGHLKMTELNKDIRLWYSHYRNHGIKKVFRCAERFIMSDVGDTHGNKKR